MHGRIIIGAMEPELAEDDRPPKTLTIEEYYRHVWRPDCDFVDGRSEERNLGTYPHATTVTALLWLLSDKQKPWRVMPLPSLRVRVSPTRVRVPDACVIERGAPDEQVLTHPPLAVIEVLEEEDRFAATMEKLGDFEQFGVGWIWVIDPRGRKVMRYFGGGLELVRDAEFAVPGTPVRVALSELFAELDRR